MLVLLFCRLMQVLLHGLGEQLKQDGHVITYASRGLNKPEQQCSVIQKECLAVAYALKQFWHYLLGHSSKLQRIKHHSNGWSAQKMESLLCCWALAIQEYDFKIEYKKGMLNGYADTLSRCSVMAITHVGQPLDDMWKAQRDDPHISMMFATLLCEKNPPDSGD